MLLGTENSHQRVNEIKTKAAQKVPIFYQKKTELQELVYMQIFHLLVGSHTQEASEAVCITMCFDGTFSQN